CASSAFHGSSKASQELRQRLPQWQRFHRRTRTRGTTLGRCSSFWWQWPLGFWHPDWRDLSPLARKRPSRSLGSLATTSIALLLSSWASTSSFRQRLTRLTGHISTCSFPGLFHRLILSDRPPFTSLRSHSSRV